jgi:chromatin remodeling complex protein RSC6
MTTNIKATQKKFDKIKQIYEYIQNNEVQTFRDLRTSVKCDTRLITFLSKKIIQKVAGKLTWTINSEPSIALARTYQSYIEIENEKVKAVKKSYRKKASSKDVAPIAAVKQKSISILWGLWTIKW